MRVLDNLSSGSPSRANEKIYKAFSEVKKEFPFKDYMDNKLPKYLTICSLILKEIPPRSKILDIGCGPCDLTAILTKLGYNLSGVDDLRDPWHLIGDNRERIKNFANKMGIKFINETMKSAKLEEKSFDAVLLLDILEHSPHPRLLINRAISVIKPCRLLLIESPNSAALAKRILLLVGKSNYPDVNFIYFNVGSYRGHIREYNISGLEKLLKVSGLTKVKAKCINIATLSLICESKGFKKFIIKLYDLVSKIYPNFRDTIVIWARKPKDWSPVDDLKAIENLKSYYPDIVKYNLENEPNKILVNKLKHFI